MGVMRKLLEFVRPYVSVLVFSSVLLGFVVVIEILTAMMVIPLFDNVLMNNPGVSAVASKKPVLELVQRSLPSNPEHVVWAIAAALMLLTILKGVCVYYSNYSMNRVGQEVGGESFLARDFKKQDGFKRSIELAKKWELYRQHYCGCVFSIWA